MAAEISAELTLEIEQFRRNMRTAFGTLETEAKKTAREAKKQGGSIGSNLKKGMIGSLKGLNLGPLLGAAGIGAVVGGAMAQLDSAAVLQATADKIGVTTEKLEEFRYAARAAANITSGQADAAFQRFTRRLGEAAKGTGELKGILETYGISAIDVDTGEARDATEVMKELANVVKGIESPAERLRVAFKMFDSEGAALVSLLSQGSAGMDRLAMNATVTGNQVISELAAAESEIAATGERLSAFFKKALAGLIGFARDAKNWVKDSVSDTQDMIVESAGPQDGNNRARFVLERRERGLGGRTQEERDAIRARFDANQNAAAAAAKAEQEARAAAEQQAKQALAQQLMGDMSVKLAFENASPEQQLARTQEQIAGLRSRLESGSSFADSGEIEAAVKELTDLERRRGSLEKATAAAAASAAAMVVAPEKKPEPPQRPGLMVAGGGVAGGLSWLNGGPAAVLAREATNQSRELRDIRLLLERNREQNQSLTPVFN